MTRWLLDHVRGDVGVLIGDIVAPAGGGWQADAAAVGSAFVPYVVLTPGTATPVDPSLGDPSQDWAVPYQLTSYGVDRTQVEDLADTVRLDLLGVQRAPVQMSSANWRVTTIRCTAIGGVGYTTAISPTAYSQTDSYTLSVSRSLA